MLKSGLANPRKVAQVLPKLTLPAVCFLLFAGTAAASPPTLDSATYDAGALEVTWTLPPGGQVFDVEGSYSPKLNDAGSFSQLDVLENPPSGATRITIRGLKPGILYVLVGGLDSDCESCKPEFSDIEYSEVMAVRISDGFRRDSESTCKSYSRPINRAFERIQQARTQERWAAGMDALAENDKLVADLRDNPARPGGDKGKRRFRAWLKGMTRGFGYFRRAAEALRNGKRDRADRHAVTAERTFARAATRAGRLKLPTCAGLL